MTSQFEAMLKDNRFWELQHRKEPIFGDWKPKREEGREVVGYKEYYDLAWMVEEGRVRWVRASTMEELPHKLVSADWL